MQRLKQLFQNSFIRVIALFRVLFRSIFGFFGNIFSSLGKTMGISDSNEGYFIDSDTKQALDKSTDKVKMPIEAVKTPEPAISSNPRPRKKSNMDDFMKMAQEINRS